MYIQTQSEPHRGTQRPVLPWRMPGTDLAYANTPSDTSTLRTQPTLITCHSSSRARYSGPPPA
eukprot:3660886-Rhodomonas_salina.1